ncbi:cyclic GMP-AMP synthase DncV-like nucleotidyltransferase [Cobetia amphilecti]|uniref:cyclic GMP-AMP synthase DncV-like nucleotidyltransferase n=1 Tax=Cobetia amphilecti TaxID=1055104 RepID=UPI003383C143
MAKLHRYFLEFHKAIKLDDLDENDTLRSKRDTLLQNLKGKLPEGAPNILRTFNQGSYAMGTGTLPLDGDYDIDVGVVFDSTSDEEAPVGLKKTVRDALSHQGRTVNIRRSCVTVSYIKGEDVQYHVDMAIYVPDEQDNLYLAKGKETSLPENCFWEASDPQGLCKAIVNRHTEDNRAQFRRVIRYLKRWRDYKFSHKGVLSISLTVAAYHWFSPYQDWITQEYDDLEALLQLLNTMINQWQICIHEGELVSRFKLSLPVEPYGDLLEKMTQKQMDDLKNKLIELRDALNDAKAEPAEAAACKTLTKFFGTDFPIPEDEDTRAAKVKASVVGTGSSA